MVLHRCIGYIQQDEIICADVERTAKVRIVGALFAGIGKRRLFVILLLLRQILKRMAHRMRRPGLLCKQQDENKQ